MRHEVCANIGSRVERRDKVEGVDAIAKTAAPRFFQAEAAEAEAATETTQAGRTPGEAPPSKRRRPAQAPDRAKPLGRRPESNKQ